MNPQLIPDHTRAATEIATLQRAIRQTMLDLHQTCRETPDLSPRAYNFIASVWEQFSTTGCISLRQYEIAQRIHDEIVGSKEVVLPGSFHATVAMLQFAAQHKKWPKMRFGYNKHGGRIALIWNKSRGRAVLTNGYAKSNWQKHFVYGTLHADGTLHLKGRVDERPEWEEVEQFLALLAQDPVQAAKTSAAITGTCTFCDSELSDPESKRRGYGPVCAENNQLPWGDKTNKHQLPDNLKDLFIKGAARA